ncbi:MAG: hypothetical protein DRP08_01785 [Candidatus Aenigmatarchaeota archaeon]|nr:MAG: hypothetical protein DRP08_01785 [Candidatus Aenigmarchaeota archaeon]
MGIFEAIKPEHALWIIALVLVASAPAILRPLPAGNDPYYYLAGKTIGLDIEPYPLVIQTLGDYLWVLVPLCLLSITLATYFLAREWGAKEPLWAVALLFGAPLLVFRLSIIEDDLIGLALCFWGLYFWVKYWNARLPSNHSDTKAMQVKTTYSSLCFALILAGLLFWRGAYVFIALLVLDFGARWKHTWPGKAWLIAAMGALCLHLPIPSLSIGEHVPFIAFPIGMLILIAGVPEIREKWVPTSLRTTAIFFVGLALLMGKFLVLGAIPLAVLTERVVQERNKKDTVLPVIAAVMVLSAWMVWAAPPSELEMQTIASVKSITGNALIANDWELGHWLTYQGANPAYTPLYPPSRRALLSRTQGVAKDNESLSKTQEDYVNGEYALTSRVSLPFEVVAHYPLTNLTLYRVRQ